MKMGRKWIALLCCAVLALSAAGCSGSPNPYRVDTVVRIPVNPTEPPAEMEAVPQTAPPAPETSAPTEPTEATESAGMVSGGTSKYTSGSSSKASQPTEAPATQPPATEAAAYDISGYTVGNLEYAVMEQINAARADAGLAALSMNTRLCAIASARAYEISSSWSHTRPDGRGYGTVLSDYGYGAGCTGEILAYATSPSAQGIVDKWIESEDTQANLLSSSFTVVGIGVYQTGGITYLACLFVG